MKQERNGEQENGDALGKALRAHFDELLSLPLPARLLDLLTELEQQSSAKTPPASGLPESGKAAGNI